MVARGARLQPPRAGEIAGEHAADALPAGLRRRAGAVVRRLERQLLAALGELGLDQRPAACPAAADITSSSGSYRLMPARPSRLTACAASTGRPSPRLLPRPEQLQRLLLGRRPGHQLAQLRRAGRPMVRLLLPRASPPAHGRNRPQAGPALTSRSVAEGPTS